jgi:hypothetical protein
MKINIPAYIIDLIKEFPEILHGRKNYKDQHRRILKTLSLIKEYKNTEKKNFKVFDKSKN